MDYIGLDGCGSLNEYGPIGAKGGALFERIKNEWLYWRMCVIVGMF